MKLVDEVRCFNDRLGPREALRSLDYFRCVEYPLATTALRLAPDLELLDMGCGSGPFALFLAAERGLQLSRLWYGMPWLLRLPLRRLAPRLAARSLQPLPSDRRDRACGVCLTLERRR